MRSRRSLFAIGWVTLALLAIAGFAAFGTPSASLEEIRVEAAAASIGHTTGAYAGVAFTPIGLPATANSSNADLGLSSDPDLATLQAASRAEAAGSDGEVSTAAGSVSFTSGWLSEVEVRALISLYFQPEDVNQAVRVAWCESRFDPESIDLRTGGEGLFHHLPRYWNERATQAGFAGSPPTDAEASTAAAAWAVYEGGGWDVFTCRG
jgi:hypothetical protein